MKNNRTIAIVDYGVGNLSSLVRAVNFFDINTVVTEESSAVMDADAVILPGVGSFKAGISGLELRGLNETIKEAAAVGKPILGICLGAQLLLTTGHEFGTLNGLGIIPGEVVHFPSLPENEKLPHIGWNNIHSLTNKKWRNTVLDSIQEKDQVYFIHSYILQPEDKNNILSMSSYGGYKFCSAIQKNNIFGLQFHPEKSGRIGLRIINNFINLISN